VLSAVREARKRCLESGRAVLLEAMSYRCVLIRTGRRYRVNLITIIFLIHSVGHHSTSDDSYAYRARAEVDDRKRIDNPISRFKLFLESQGWWNEDEEEALKARLRKDVLEAFKKAEARKRNNLGELFTDVYGGEEPWNIKEQREELARLLKKYGDSWEPWRLELAKFKDKGQDLLK